jgi:hypothetical protein
MKIKNIFFYIFFVALFLKNIQCVNNNNENKTNKNNTQNIEKKINQKKNKSESKFKSY